MSVELRTRGHEVYGTTSGIGASSLVARHGIDVVVVDLELTSFPAPRLVELLRKQSRLERLGVVLVSSHPPDKVEVGRADAAISKRNLFLLPRAVSQVFATRHNQVRTAPGPLAKIAGA
jgi:hypothetical protein